MAIAMSACCPCTQSIPMPTWTRLQVDKSVSVRKWNSPQGRCCCGASDDCGWSSSVSFEHKLMCTSVWQAYSWSTVVRCFTEQWMSKNVTCRSASHYCGMHVTIIRCCIVTRCVVVELIDICLVSSSSAKALDRLVHYTELSLYCYYYYY